MSKKLGAKLACQARYNTFIIVAKFEYKFGLISRAYSKKLSVNEFTEIIKQMHDKL